MVCVILAAVRNAWIFVTPSCFHRVLVEALSDLVIMAVASLVSRSVRYRFAFFASHSSAASTVTFTTLAESKAVSPRSVQVVLVARSYSPTATVPFRFASAAVMSFFSLSASPACFDVQLTAGAAAAAGANATAADVMTIPAPIPAASTRVRLDVRDTRDTPDIR